MHTLDTVMNYLNAKIAFSRSDLFYRIFSAGLLLQPLAIWLQAVKAWRSDSLEGLSVWTFVAFVVLQIIGMLYGIRVKEPVILAAMSASFCASLTILAAFLIR